MQTCIYITHISRHIVKYGDVLKKMIMEIKLKVKEERWKKH